MSDRPSLAGAFRPAARPPTLDRGSDIARSPNEIVVVDGPGQVHNVAVYLPVALRDQVRERARARNLTITDLVEEAFVQHGANYHHLTPTPTHRPGSMPTRSSQRRGNGTIQIQLRLDDRQHQWLDNQVERYGAPSRSALVAAVLSRHLGEAR